MNDFLKELDNTLSPDMIRALPEVEVKYVTHPADGIFGECKIAGSCVNK